MHHFHFTADMVKHSSDDCEKKIKLLKDLSWKPSKFSFPQQIILPGLSLECQWYSLQKVRELRYTS